MRWIRLTWERFASWTGLSSVSRHGDMDEVAQGDASSPGIPPSEWQVFPENDWAELSGPPPLYLAEDGKTMFGVGGKKVGTLNDDGSVDWEPEEEEGS